MNSSRRWQIRLISLSELSRIFVNPNPAFGGAQIVIWSNETMGTRWNAIAPFISRIRPETEVRVVIYFRNQVDWLVSAYLQWAIKDKQNKGRILPWSDYIRSAMTETDYVKIVNSWVKATDRSVVLARSYDMAEDIVADFYAAAGLSFTYKPNDRRIYETPNYTALSLLKIYNDQFDERMSPEPLLSILGHAGVLSRDFHSVNPAPLDVSDEELDALEESFVEMNGKLEQNYGLRLKPRRRAGNLHPREPSTDGNTDILAALLTIIVDLDRQVRNLRRTVATLKGP